MGIARELVALDAGSTAKALAEEKKEARARIRRANMLCMVMKRCAGRKLVKKKNFCYLLLRYMLHCFLASSRFFLSRHLSVVKKIEKEGICADVTREEMHSRSDGHCEPTKRNQMKDDEVEGRIKGGGKKWREKRNQTKVDKQKGNLTLIIDTVQ